MSKPLQSLISGIQSNSLLSNHSIVEQPAERDAAAKLIQYFAKLPVATRAAILPAIQEIAGISRLLRIN